MLKYVSLTLLLTLSVGFIIANNHHPLAASSSLTGFSSYCYAAYAGGDDDEKLEHKEQEKAKPAPKPAHPAHIINARALGFMLTKDRPQYLNCVNDKPGKIFIFHALMNKYRYGIENLIYDKSPLALGVIDGDIEMVELLLVPMTQIEGKPIDELKNQCGILKNTLRLLMDCSSLCVSSAGRKSAAPLFRYFALPVLRRYENYPIIAHLLIQALKKIQPSVDAHYLQQHPDENSSLPSTQDMFDLLEQALCNGTPEIMQVIAEELAKTPAVHRWQWLPGPACRDISTFEKMVHKTINGEKLGILLTTAADPSSIVFQMGMGMLSHVEKNPRLLARLKNYVRNYQLVYRPLDRALPDSLSIVLGYLAAEPLPADTAQYILDLQPAPVAVQPNENGDDDQPLLGQHLKLVMLKKRQLTDRA